MMKLFIFLATFSTLSYSNTYKYSLVNKEIKVWDYRVSIEGFFQNYLDFEKFENEENEYDFQIETIGFQSNGRYLKRANISFKLLDDNGVELQNIKSSKACIGMNCSVHDFLKVLRSNIYKLNNL